MSHYLAFREGTFSHSVTSPGRRIVFMGLILVVVISLYFVPIASSKPYVRFNNDVQ
jgi:hypothetical protein